jgi:YHS domain-containing protein
MKKENEKTIAKTIITTFSLLLCFISFNSFAVDEIYTGFLSNTAIKGYDTVAYFNESKAVKGNKEYQYEWKGVTWQFANQKNLDLFAAKPEDYAPQYGGWCSYAVSQNSTASIEPDQFTIFNNKLYLNYDSSVNKKWLANKEQYINDADKYWPKILNK